MTMTLAGDVVMSLLVALVADRVGRRRILFAGGLLMVLSGAVFAVFEDYWVLLLAAVVGVVSATGGDFVRSRSVEESTLSYFTTLETRSDVLSWYVTTSSLGSAVGTEISGRVVDFLRGLERQTATGVYHSMFWVYIATGAMNMVLTCLMSDRCEATTAPPTGTKVTEPLLGAGRQDASSDGDDGDVDTPLIASDPDTPSRKAGALQYRQGMNIALSCAGCGEQASLPKSRQSRAPSCTGCGALLTIDSLADGMVSYALTNYYLARKFRLSESYLGDIMLDKLPAFVHIDRLCRAACPTPRPRQHHGVHAHALLCGGAAVPHTAVGGPDHHAALRPHRPEQHGPSAAGGLDRGSGEARGAHGGHGDHGHAEDARVDNRAEPHGLPRRQRQVLDCLCGCRGLVRIGYDVGLFCLFVGLKLDANEPGRSDRR